MPVLNIRGVPVEVMVRLKMEAVQAGMTLRAYVLGKLGWVENGQKTLKTKAREEGVAVKVEANPARLPDWLNDKVLPASQLPEPAKKKRRLNLGGEPTGPKRMDYTKTW